MCISTAGKINSKMKPLKKIVDKELFLLDKLILMGDPFLFFIET